MEWDYSPIKVILHASVICVTQTSPHGCAQRLVSRVTLDPIKLIVFAK